MKTKIITFIAFFTLLSVSCKKDFLTRYPLDSLTDDTYWTGERNVRTFAYGFYPGYFVGYGAGWTWGKYYVRTGLSDNYGQSSPAQFVRVVPTSGGGWSFTWVRKANLFIDRVQSVPMEEEAIAHWTGVGRFFRGLEYFDLVKRFGDMPWYDAPIESSDEESLYKPRMSRAEVMSNVLADFQYAAEHVRESDGEKGLTVNKMVVLAYMSRVFLFEGTWQKYHGGDQAKATEFLEAAKWAANEVITKGGFSFSNTYRESFNSLDLSTNQEMILYKKYDTGQTTHTLVSYVNREGQTGPNKDLMEDYLCSDGLPISISPNYQGDKTIEDVMADRDSRLYGTIAPDLRPNGYTKPEGVLFGASTTGYAVLKFLNEEIMNTKQGLSLDNTTDAPIIRYGEVLVNYAEAAYELGGMTQNDLDISINVLRTERPGSNLPKLEIMGGQPAVNGSVYDDPERDPGVPSMLWEIRRERRIELVMEGFRYDDLRRWAKLEYMDTEKNTDLNRGAWIKKSDYPNLSTSVRLENGADEGYMVPATAERIFSDEKVYLYPLPLDQIKLYQDQGAELTQNPGW